MSSRDEPAGTLAQEIARLRDWRHDHVDPELLAHGWRIDALDRVRKDVERRLVLCENELQTMTKADEIARAVSDQVRKDRQLGLTLLQKVGVGAFALCSPLASALILKALGG